MSEALVMRPEETTLTISPEQLENALMRYVPYMTPHKARGIWLSMLAAQQPRVWGDRPWQAISAAVDAAFSDARPLDGENTSQGKAAVPDPAAPAGEDKEPPLDAPKATPTPSNTHP